MTYPMRIVHTSTIETAVYENRTYGAREGKEIHSTLLKRLRAADGVSTGCQPFFM